MICANCAWSQDEPVADGCIHLLVQPLPLPERFGKRRLKKRAISRSVTAPLLIAVGAFNLFATSHNGQSEVHQYGQPKANGLSPYNNGPNNEPEIVYVYDAMMKLKGKTAPPPLPDLPLWKAVRFEPPDQNTTPKNLFTPHALELDINDRCRPTAHRLIRHGDSEHEIFIYTNVSCLDQNDAIDTSVRQAGCAFIFKPEPYHLRARSCSFRLEKQGPTGKVSPQTSNGAELRAVIATLQFRR